MFVVERIVVVAFVSVGFFVAGMAVMRRIIHEEQDMAEYNAKKSVYYNYAGVKRAGDPKPYIPPIQKCYNAFPYMKEMENRLRSNRRGVMILRAGDRRNFGF